MDKEEYETKAQNVAMEIIAYSGDGRSLAFKALDAVHSGDFKKADELLKKSTESIGKAHNMQTNLLVEEANGRQTPFSILLVHSQDHFMSSMLANELISEIVRVYKKLDEKDHKNE